jgi:hypothetical protein
MFTWIAWQINAAARVILFSAAILSLIGVTAPAVDRHVSDVLAFSERVARDVESIRDLPIDADDRRLWMYRVPAREFAAGFVLRMSGVRSVAEREWNAPAIDKSSYLSSPADWRYVVIDNRSRTIDQLLRDGFVKDASGTRAEFGAGAKISELDELIVVERRRK